MIATYSNNAGADGEMSDAKHKEIALRCHQAGAADMRERAAKCCDAFDAPVSDSEFVNAQAIAAQQIRAMIRALPLEDKP